MGNKQVGVSQSTSQGSLSFSGTISKKKLFKIQKKKIKAKQQRIRSILLEEAKVIEKPFKVNFFLLIDVQKNGKSPLDDSLIYIRDTLDKLNFCWAEKLLLAFNVEIAKFLRFQVLQWTIEIKQVEETSKLQITSDASMEYFNLSTQIIDNPIQEEMNEDGSMVMKTEDNGNNLDHQKDLPFTSLDDCPPFSNNESPTNPSDTDNKTRHNLFSMKTKSQLNFSDFPILQRQNKSNCGTMKQQSSYDKNKLTEVIQEKLPTKLFHAKLELILKHIQRKDHPLKILYYLFSKKLHDFFEKNKHNIFNERADSIQAKCAQLDIKGFAPCFGGNFDQESCSGKSDDSEINKKGRKKLFKDITESVKTFRLLFKRALLKFYSIDINELKKSSQNQLDSQILWFILGKKVSKILFEAAKLAFDEEIEEFKKAIRVMKDEQINFFNVDPQFELEEESYQEYLKMQESPLKVDVTKLDDLDVAFRIERLETMDKENSISKSNLLLLREDDAYERINILSGPSRQNKEMITQSQKKMHHKTDETPKNNLLSNGKMNAVRSPDITQTNNQFKKNIIRPYPKSPKVLKVLSAITTLSKKKDVIHYVWNKIQNEVFEYWKNKDIKQSKLIINEDNRLSIICYVIVQSQCVDLYATVQALIPFINQQLYEEAAPITTFENGINAVIQDFNEQFGENYNESKGQSNNNFIQDYAQHHQLGSNCRAPSIYSIISKRSNAVYSHRETYKHKMTEIRETTKILMNEQNLDNSEDIKKEEEYLQKRMKTETRGQGILDNRRMLIVEDSSECSQQMQSFIDPDIYNRSFEQINLKNNIKKKDNKVSLEKNGYLSGSSYGQGQKYLQQKLGAYSANFKNKLVQMNQNKLFNASQIDSMGVIEENSDFKLSAPYKTNNIEKS